MATEKCKVINEIVDERGFSLYFANLPLRQFHIVSVSPGMIRGNHVHEYDELICVIGGKNLAEITLESSEDFRQFIVGNEYLVIKIPAGVKHIVRNIGDKVFYLVCFSLEGIYGV